MCIMIILGFYLIIYPKIIKNDIEEDEEYIKEECFDKEKTAIKQERLRKIEEHCNQGKPITTCQDFEDLLIDQYLNTDDVLFKRNILAIIQQFFPGTDDTTDDTNDDTTDDTNDDTSENQNTRTKNYSEQHGLNPFNDPYFRAYLKDYTDLSKSENRKLVSEFMLDPLKTKILHWLCFEGSYVIPSYVNTDVNKKVSKCDLSSISEFSESNLNHNEKPKYHHCFCKHTNKTPEKYLGRYHSDGILEKLNHQCQAELEEIDENLLTHSMINLDDNMEIKSSTSLNDLVNLNKINHHKKQYLCDLIKHQQQTGLEMNVNHDQKDTQRFLIGSVGDNVIYLSVSQINLFHYLIHNNILQYLKNNWNNIHAFYLSNKNN